MKLFELIKIIILSIVQGITEILPISSSGHLIIFESLLDINNTSLSLPVFLHFGSFIAVILYYKKDLKTLFFDSFYYIFKNNKDCKSSFNLTTKIIISTFITGLFGIFFSKYIEIYFTNIFTISITFFITGILLLLISNIKGNKSLNDLTIKDAVIIGFLQLIGIIPGISRSGITISGSKICKLNNEDSFRYSYLLFIPITLCSFILELYKLFQNNCYFEFPFLFYIIGIIVSFLFTYFSLKLLSKIIKNGKLYYFSYYLFFVIIILLILG